MVEHCGIGLGNAWAWGIGYQTFSFFTVVCGWMSSWMAWGSVVEKEKRKTSVVAAAGGPGSANKQE